MTEPNKRERLAQAIMAYASASAADPRRSHGEAWEPVGAAIDAFAAELLRPFEELLIGWRAMAAAEGRDTPTGKAARALACSLEETIRRANGEP